jgi:hypothetical protein
VSLSTVQSNVAQLGQGFKQIEREIPLSSEDPSDPFRAMMTEFFDKKKEECNHLEADTKTMEVRRLALLWRREAPSDAQRHTHLHVNRRTSSSLRTRSARAPSARPISSSPP